MFSCNLLTCKLNTYDKSSSGYLLGLGEATWVVQTDFLGGAAIQFHIFDETVRLELLLVITCVCLREKQQG